MVYLPIYSRKEKTFEKMEKFIKKFSEIGIEDIAQVGGKNASLGEMVRYLSKQGIVVPNGFAVTASAFSYFLIYNKLSEFLSDLLRGLDRIDFSNLEEIGNKARERILAVKLPTDLEDAIGDAYHEMFGENYRAVAVRSSATAEDLPQASFAGQHETYLNIRGITEVLNAVKHCYASLYTNRAIKYREDKGFSHDQVLLSVGIQEMVRADLGCAGVGFTLEPESGFKDVVHLAAVWGLGENIVQGTVNPDEYLVFKPSLKRGLKSIIQKKLGSKSKMMGYAADGDLGNTVNVDTPALLKEKFVLNDIEIETLAKWAVIIEQHYQKPMDFEWAKDGINKQLYIVQARPETIHNSAQSPKMFNYHLKECGKVLASGQAIGRKIVAGRAKVLLSPKDANELNFADILITNFTSPDWDPILKKVAGIVTDQGGRTSHAAIIARELGTLAIVGCGDALANIKDGEMITLNCCEGKIGNVLQGKIDWEQTEIDLKTVTLPEYPKAQLIISDPENAFELAKYPNHGVGLIRMEFMISNHICIHPMALLEPQKVSDSHDFELIDKLTSAYPSGSTYFVEKLSQGIAMIASAFYPKEVILRMSDFKSNEYRNLIGGNAFEPIEENPMIGFRGASRYYHENYKKGFQLECEAIKVVRNEMGLDNIKLMVPFCRTVEEGEKVIKLMREYGLKQHENGLEIFVMAEIPSNVLLASDFAKIFDGFSIGSNDLTQLTLGIDRDSALIADLFDEQNAASKMLIINMIEKAKKLGKHVGICGQAPSDSETFASLVIEHGIDSIAFNPDALLKGIELINKVKDKMRLIIVN